MDPEAQKLIETFHRYGLQKPSAANACPFKDGALRNRFTSLIGQNSVMTVYEEQSKTQRKAIMGFFNSQKLEELKEEWRGFTKEWLCQHINQDEVNLFSASLVLIGKCLIKGLLGYQDCTDAEIQLNTEFWKSLFELSPPGIEIIKTQEAEGKPPQSSFMGKLLEYPLSVYSYCVKKTHDYLYPGMSKETDPTEKFQQLAYKIYKSTVGNPKSLCHHLAQQGWSEELIFENVKILLMAGQETAGYLLGYMLYEYAQQRDLQEKHVEQPEDIEKAYLETLRRYSLGGSLRDARYDMVLSYPDANGTIKQHYIRKGDRINCAPYLWGHDPRQWENPEQFDPNRLQLEKVNKNPHFGYGPHRCIGEKTAHKELLTIVEEVLSNTRLLAKDKMPELLDAFTFRPMHDIKMKFDLEYKSLKYVSLIDIPKHWHTREIYLACLKNNWKGIYGIPEDQRDAEIYLAAVRKNGNALRDCARKI